ncbi:hypothetical protein [Streptomyces cucumeris]|uniref:hypothetical protein n=1 Tax=Streptomyces cucumeris TaxID=2962890 RepID=UPI003D75A27B
MNTAEQTVAINKARAYVEAAQQPIDKPTAGQLLGHLMAAELLLAEIVTAFKEPAPTTT